MAENTEQEITELTDILDKDIEAIVALRLKSERKVSRHQRLIERITSTIGRPGTVYLILAFVALWIILNALDKLFGLPGFDAPPFPWLQQIVSLCALVVTVIVLTTQNRQERMAEQRRHLDLQINLLTERKVSKMISLLEELRHDLPVVSDRKDSEAEAMKEPVDPHSALSALNEGMQAAAREHKLNL